jgi:porphobilinogen synthase
MTHPPPNFRRFRPLRETAADRDRNAEVHLAPEDFILPFFVVPGTGVDRPLATLTGVSHLSVDRLVSAVQRATDAGVRRILIFGVPDAHEKGPDAPSSRGAGAVVARAVEAVKGRLPSLSVTTDVCLCAYTDHGHCGVLGGDGVDNDATLPILAEMALTHARAGADTVAPSAMMDGQVAAIRARLDGAGFAATAILGYSAKYASRLYGPFREAAHSAPSKGDRKSYQMDPRCRSQALDEVAADLAEGAAEVMVKPATFYLDVVSRVRHRYPQVPLVAYHTSGEAMLLRHGAAAGLFAWKDALLENLWAIKGAGVDQIISYDAVDAIGFLR